MVFHSDFFATDNALMRLKRAISLRDLARQLGGASQPVYRSWMREEAKKAVASAKQYRRARSS